MENLLSMLLPAPILQELSERKPKSDLPSHSYTKATVCQSDLVGFTQLASTRRPDEVVGMIGDIFGIFDSLTDEYQIYKVETIGDAYLAAQAEHSLTDVNR